MTQRQERMEMTRMTRDSMKRAWEARGESSVLVSVWMMEVMVIGGGAVGVGEVVVVVSAMMPYVGMFVYRMYDAWVEERKKDGGGTMVCGEDLGFRAVAAAASVAASLLLLLCWLASFVPVMEV